MTCAACVANVEQALQNMDGVSEVAVNLALESATVNVSSDVEISALQKAVARAGYQLNPSGRASLIQRQQKNLKSWRDLLLIQLLFGFPLILMAMLEMFSIWSWPGTAGGILTQLILATVMVVTARGYYIRGVRHLLQRAPNMDSLITLGTGSAFLFSLATTVNLSFDLAWPVLDHLYFEAVGAILLFITLGKWLEALARQKTTESLSGLSENMPRTALVWQDEEWQEIALEALNKGDRIRILPHTQIPVDGTIVKGFGLVDEAAITGESIPINKQLDDRVLSATQNLEQTLEVIAESIGRESVYGQVIQLVEDAQSRKPAIQQLADRVAAVFVPVVLGLALLSGIAWILLGYGVAMGFQTFVSVLIIACPCALGLATPTALVMGSGIMARAGIVLKNPDALQALDEMTTLILDKTGSLTQGQPAVAAHWPTHADKHLIMATALEAQATHPLAEALKNYARQQGLNIPEANNVEQTPGIGLTGMVDGQQVSIQAIGDRHQLESEPARLIETWRQNGFSTSAVHAAGELQGLIAFSDPLRDGSKAVVGELTGAGVKVVLISGDHHSAVEFAAKEAGISSYYAKQLPSDKHHHVEALQAQGEKVGMLGDGINDAPALVSANVGLSFSSGTDIAVNAADMIFLQDSLTILAIARQQARRTLRKIRQNLFWAFIYNIIGIPIAMGILYLPFGILLNPMFAGLAMAFSSVSVVSNTLLLGVHPMRRINPA